MRTNQICGPDRISCETSLGAKLIKIARGGGEQRTRGSSGSRDDCYASLSIMKARLQMCMRGAQEGPCSEATL